MMKKLMVFWIVTVICPALYGAGEQDEISLSKSDAGLAPWCGSYCMSFFTKTRSAKTVGKGHLSVSLKYQFFDWNQVYGSDNAYHRRTSGQSKERSVFVLCMKYGWAEDHHIALGIPYWINDFDIPGKENDSHGVANIYIFEKWNIIKETNNFPGVAIDFWYYFPSGDSDRSLGNDESAYKVSTEISKAWKNFSIHFNPNYKWSADKDADVGELNAAILWTMNKQVWPAIEYNYIDKEGKGHSHDIVPGVIWKFKKGWSFKVGVPISVDSTMTDRDRVGVVFKLFRKW